MHAFASSTVCSSSANTLTSSEWVLGSPSCGRAIAACATDSNAVDRRSSSNVAAFKRISLASTFSGIRRSKLAFFRKKLSSTRVVTKDHRSRLRETVSSNLAATTPYYRFWLDNPRAVDDEAARQPLPYDKLVLTRGFWNFEHQSPKRCRLVGRMTFANLHARLDTYIPSVRAEAVLLAREAANKGVDNVGLKVSISSAHPDPAFPARPDGFWFSYILKAQKQTTVVVTIDIEADPSDATADLSHLQSTLVHVHYTSYGRQGVEDRMQSVVLPLQLESSESSTAWREGQTWKVLPVKTHLLTHCDSPVTVLQKYAVPLAQPGDIVCIAESPVAIMQGRFRNPREIRPGWVARLLNYLFDNASSLSTACGMQALVDIVGPLRVMFAAFVAAVLRVFLRKRGMFYNLAGEQARLVDDVSGTIPPYDQFVVLGPKNASEVVADIERKTGLKAAIVDVNDLHRVKVLASSPDVNEALLEEALLDNPAGNANQQTPIVLVRRKAMSS